MNCFGTNPRFSPAPKANFAAPQEGTISMGEWSQPVPVNPDMPTSPASVPADIENANTLPPTLSEAIYTPGYLSQHIGDLMRVEFLLGSAMTDRVGFLKNVGASFIVLAALDGSSEILCDIYSIKFVTIINDATQAQLYASFQ